MSVRVEGKKHSHSLLIFYFEDFAASFPWLYYDAVVTIY